MRIRAALSAAACALIGTASPPARAADVESGLLFYSEFDRVSLLESTTLARRSLGSDRNLNLKLVVDIMTGASPNGALPAPRPVTFTHPSGRTAYVVPAGKLPLDHIFQDNRFALAAGVDVPVGSESRLSTNAGFSIEYDYRSLTLDGSLQRTFDRGNTTVTAAASLAHDTVRPEGGIPIAFASMARARAEQPRDVDSRTKDTIEGLVSATQTLSRSMLGQINYAWNRSAGYNTDPFKLITVIDGEPGADLGRALQYVYENRPDRRTKQSLFGKIKRYLSGDIVDLSYRFQWDDWDLSSHTVESHYRRHLGASHYLEPHVRFYHQSGVGFFRHSLIEGEAFPKFVTADSRQARFDALTVGLKYGRDGSQSRPYSARVEYYVQMHDNHPDDALGQQKDRELIPDLRALIAQITYSFDWW